MTQRTISPSTNISSIIDWSKALQTTEGERIGGKLSEESETGESAELMRAYACAGEAEAAQFLHRLFEEYISRWCSEAARRTLRNYGVRGADRDDEEADVVAEVMLQLTARLHEVRRGASLPIENLRAYAATAVRNACVGRVRARCPRHVQLQNRIRYLLRNDQEFAAWTSGTGQLLAGLRTWTGREDAAEAVVPQRSGGSLKELLKSVFELSCGPLALNDLLGAVADSLGVVEPSADGGDPDCQASAAPDADRVLIEREDLAALWSEVVRLPSSQRTALLLNLGVIELIPVTGTASFAELSNILGLSQAALADVWPDLPLGDARIAEMLGITRQQVINLRKSARERLMRRQRGSGSNTAAQSASHTAGGVLQALLRRGRRS